jgi:hypothetical protein
VLFNWGQFVLAPILGAGSFDQRCSRYTRCFGSHQFEATLSRQPFVLLHRVTYRLKSWGGTRQSHPTQRALRCAVRIRLGTRFIGCFLRSLGTQVKHPFEYFPLIFKMVAVYRCALWL